MSRHVLFVLLLGTGLVLAGGRAEARQDGPAGAPARTETAERRTADAPASGEAPQERTAGPQAEPGEAQGQTDTPRPETQAEPTLTTVPGGSALGMSILGNQEAPTSLVIVPWKTSELGTSLGIAPMLDDSRQPVDKDVFMRALRYYEIRSSETKP